jgi:type IV secretory pathway TraG/TraD family ATPase VirD4
MHPDDKRRYAALLILIGPVFGWFYAVKYTETLGPKPLANLYPLLKATPDRPLLILGAIAGLLFAVLAAYLLFFAASSAFEGQPYRRFIRGTRVATFAALVRKTRNKKLHQVELAGVPMPLDAEIRHTLIAGGTGTGKTVLFKGLAWSAMQRRDRLIIADPNGEMYSLFGRPGDKIANPYDQRTVGWSIFNEIRDDYDFNRYALSLVPRGRTNEEEEWASFARLLLRETARKLVREHNPSIERLIWWTTIAEPDRLKTFLHGTDAESLFTGADKALASARFMLADKITEHKKMPSGEFSLRDWLDDPKGGNLFLTWNEAQATALKPLISAWVDVLCTSILSLPASDERRVWLFLDELASLEKLPSLEAALTKGRKAGLRVVAGLQSTSQLDAIYGHDEAQTLRSCFRTLAALGGAMTDAKTSEDISKSLGEHEVERYAYSRSSGDKGSNSSKSLRTDRERVVMPSQITGWPDLTGYVAFVGNLPIAKFQLAIQPFVAVNAPFVKREAEA